jgi:hypothetical protein
MKLTIIANLLLFGILFLSKNSYSQTNLNHSSNKIQMENTDSLKVSFIDKFFVPKNSIDEFKQKMKYNRNFVSNLTGYVKGDAFEQKDNEGNLIIITIAIWQNQEYLDKAKILVQAEFKRIKFNPVEFYERLNVKIERGLYKILND